MGPPRFHMWPGGKMQSPRLGVCLHTPANSSPCPDHALLRQRERVARAEDPTGGFLHPHPSGPIFPMIGAALPPMPR